MGWLKSVHKAISEAQMRRVAYWQLQNLTDKDLKDIGITRGEIREAARGI